MPSLVGVLPLPVLFVYLNCIVVVPSVFLRDAFVFARSCTSDQLCREQKFEGGPSALQTTSANLPGAKVLELAAENRAA